MLAPATVSKRIHSMASGHQSSNVDVQAESRPQRISIDPKLYKAALEGDVDFLNKFLQSQGKTPTVPHIYIYIYIYIYSDYGDLQSTQYLCIVCFALYF
jgi:hypothetical protein